MPLHITAGVRWTRASTSVTSLWHDGCLWHVGHTSTPTSGTEEDGSPSRRLTMVLYLTASEYCVGLLCCAIGLGLPGNLIIGTFVWVFVVVGWSANVCMLTVCMYGNIICVCFMLYCVVFQCGRAPVCIRVFIYVFCVCTYVCEGCGQHGSRRDY